ncbi:toxin-antitoxin system, antitoxin component, Xre family protein [Chamaesiphon sp.]|uniref:toxin-antitoxin system, antitoxin component, Xre family protein n=1 Tax=Chamaesiphon sp. TaxID=2814140 RepID=UPI003593A15E
MITDTIEQRLLAKIRKLSATKVVEIEDFIDFLYEREIQSDANLTLSATKLSEATFAKVWNNPEDAAYDNL